MADSAPSTVDAQIDALIERFGLTPLPDEGGLWAQSWRDEHGSAIYFLMRPGDFSAMHRLSATELWHFYAGDTVELLLLHPSGESETIELGSNVLSGHAPFVAVPAATWMGAKTTGQWSLVGTTVAPPFADHMFELGHRRELAAQYPREREQIESLTRQA